MSPFTDPLLDVRFLVAKLGDELESLAQDNKALKAENARLTRELVAAQAQRDTAITGAYADRRAP